MRAGKEVRGGRLDPSIDLLGVANGSTPCGTLVRADKHHE
jgi:hypothetical protein